MQVAHRHVVAAAGGPPRSSSPFSTLARLVSPSTRKSRYICLGDALVVRRQLGQRRVEGVPERHQVRARLLQRVVVLLQVASRARPPASGPPAPSAWPITSWKATSHLRAVAEYLRARSRSSARAGELDAPAAAASAPRAVSIDVAPPARSCCRTSRGCACSLGRLMPAGGCGWLVDQVDGLGHRLRHLLAAVLLRPGHPVLEVLRPLGDELHHLVLVRRPGS